MIEVALTGGGMEDEMMAEFRQVWEDKGRQRICITPKRKWGEPTAADLQPHEFGLRAQDESSNQN